MTEGRALQGQDWADLVQVTHLLTNMITVRSHYSEGHPAIGLAEEQAAQELIRLLERVDEIVLALLEGEIVICDRPFPDLGTRVKALADGMLRHRIECIVFQHGVTPEECRVLGRALASAPDETGRTRERTQASLVHVLFRYASLRQEEKERLGGQEETYLVPLVRDVLVHTAHAIKRETPIDVLTIRAVANRMVSLAGARAFKLEPRSWLCGLDDEAIHATNVACASAAMAMAAGYPEATCVDLAAAAILHDVGHLLLPDEIRGVPEPLLDERAIPVFRNHAFAGALVLLGAGCPPLWVAVALEHHRGVDGGGYPALDSKEPPHELVRIVALANFFDRQRTSLAGRQTEPEALVREIAGLESRYFGAPLLDLFLKTLGVYPAGTVVELSDRQPAVVLRVSGADPLRPQVSLLRGPQAGKRLELRAMDAKEGRHQRSIVRAIAPPLFVPGDVVEPEAHSEPEVPAHEVTADEGGGDKAVPEAAQPAEPRGEEKARAELSHMGSMLDDLASVGDALRGVTRPPIGPPSAPLIAAAPVVPAPVVPAPVVPAPPPAVAPPMSVPMPQRPAAPAPTAQSLRPMPGLGVPPMPVPMPVRQEPPAPRQVAHAPASPPAEPRSSAGTPSSQSPIAAAQARPGSLAGIPALAVSGAELSKLDFDHPVGTVLLLVDGARDVASLADILGLSREEVEQILADLVTKGIVRMR